MSLIKCPECGQNVSDRAKFCPNCGKSINGAAAQAKTVTPMLQPSKQRKDKVWLSVLIVIILVVIGVVCYMTMGEHSPATNDSTDMEIPKSRADLEIIIYSDDSGEILDSQGKRICGAELSGGRKGHLSIRTSVSVDFFGTNTSEIYIDGDRAFADFGEYLDCKYDNGECRISCQRKEEGTTLHFLLSRKGGESVSKSDKEDAPIQPSIPTKLKKAKTKAEVKKLLDGTTWHYTESLSSSDIGCWVKVVFKGDRYTSYYAKPADGQWTEGGSGAFEVVDGRYSDTGNKYICVNWNGTLNMGQSYAINVDAEMSFTMDNFQFNVHSIQIDAVLSERLEPIILKGTMEFGDYTWN